MDSGNASTAALSGAALLAATLLGGCDSDSSSDVADLEISQAAVDGEYGSHVAIYEEWYQGPTRGDLADDSALIDTALDEALAVIEDEAADTFNNGEVMGEPRAAFAVDTEYGAVVYAIGHIEYHIDAQSYTASDVPLPFGVVVTLNDQGEVAATSTETPVSQAESATGPPEGPFALAAYADPDGDQLLVLDTGAETWATVGIRQGDPETGPIAVQEPWRQVDVADGYSLIDTTHTVPYTADVRTSRKSLPPSGTVTGEGGHHTFRFDAFLSCCATRAVSGGKAPLSKREAKQLVQDAAGNRISADQYAADHTYNVFQARLPDGGVAVVREVNGHQVLGARFADGSMVASRCVVPEEVRAYVCHVPGTKSWLVGTDRGTLDVRTEGGDWRPSTGMVWSQVALVDGESPQLRSKVKGEWVTVDLEQAYEQSR